MTETESLELDFEGLQAARERGSLLVDVLPASQFAWAHIAGAVSLPLEELPEGAARVLGDPAREVVVYCGGPT